ncbi:MAG: tyrosine-protein phosphatase [Anaerolineaceae bacterium]|nr:tyrosine-protein phosphatase [Anaerolineaceae bacterium]
MKTSIILDQLISFTSTHPEVSGLALLGSHLRGDAGPWADVDLVFLVPRQEVIIDVLEDCTSSLSNEIKHIIKPESNKWVILTTALHCKIDIIAVADISDIELFYRSSKITDPMNAILVDKEGFITKAFRAWSNDEENSDLSILVNNEVEKFIESFELASRYAQQGDVFRFYFNYNLSLTRYGRLVQLTRDDNSFIYTPRKLLEGMGQNQRRATERLAAPLVLSEVRPVLNRLKAEFLSIYSKLLPRHHSLTRTNKEVNEILQDILSRDMIWNLRDIAWIAPDIIKEGQLFRSSTLSRFEHERKYDALLDRLGIRRIIDLRCDHERARYPYSHHTSERIEIVELSMGMESENKRVFGPRTGVTHVDFLDNSRVVSDYFSLLAEEIPTLIHCHSGKDRTGVLISLVQLAVGLPLEMAYRDFLASGMDLTKKNADEFFSKIEELGGIGEVLARLGVAEHEVTTIRRWLLN